jgi:hypothetical protein
MIGLVDLRVAKNLLDELKGATEQVLTKLFEARMCKLCVEVNTLK